MKKSSQSQEDSGIDRLTGRPSSEVAAALHNRVIAAAFDCFLSKGYSNTTFEAVAAAAEVNRGTLYRRYTNKTNLFLAVIRWKLGQFAQGRKMVAPPGEELAFVRFAMRDMLDFTLEPTVLRLMKVLLAESERFPEIYQQVTSWQTSQFTLPMEDALSRLAERGELSVPDPVLSWRTFFYGVCGEPWMPHMFGIFLFDTVEKRDAHFERRWHEFLSKHDYKSLL